MPDGGDVQRRVGTVAYMSLEQASRTESCEGDHALESLSGLAVLGRPLRGKNLGNLLWRRLVQTMGALAKNRHLTHGKEDVKRKDFSPPPRDMHLTTEKKWAGICRGGL